MSWSRLDLIRDNTFILKGAEQKSNKGIYTIIISIQNNISLRIGRLGHIFLPKGLYLYTGSALSPGGINQRLQRHLKRKKKIFWHIDYLLSSKGVSIKAIVYSHSSEKMECDVNKSLLKFLSVPSKGFGSSDCTKSCRSHLLRFDGNSKDCVMKLVCLSYRKCGLNPILIPKVTRQTRS